MTSETNGPDVAELDVRGMRKPDKHPTIFATFDALEVGGSFVLINDHDPKHLHDEFERDVPGGYGWEYLNTEMRDWRIRISKTAATPLPRVLIDTADLPDEPDALGALWKLTMTPRDLDSNIIALTPSGKIDAHTGPDLDVMLHVLAGSGTLTTETGEIDLRPGQLVWLPRRSQRAFTAGPDGLRYLTVHQKRESLLLGATRLND